MSEITCTTEWTRREDENFTDNRYSREHRWQFDGGIQVLASSSPSVVPPPMSNEKAVDPEEAFVASLSSCHMLWFLALAARKGLVVDRYVDEASGRMQKNENGKMFISVVTLRPKIDWGSTSPSPEDLDDLHHLAHEECFIANSVRTKVEIESQG